MKKSKRNCLIELRFLRPVLRIVERNLINIDNFSSLAEIVVMVLDMKPTGGRFHADENSVFLTDFEENEMVCKIKLTNS